MTSRRDPIELLDPGEPDFNVALVRDLLADQFPAWKDLPVSPVESDGHDNRTFRLGHQMCVRLPSHERYAAQVPKEQTWLPRLRPLLPLSIPMPLAMGVPGAGYPWHWSVYGWLEGEPAASHRIGSAIDFANALAGFLTALHRIDGSEGPRPGSHNFFRGGSLAVYDAEARAAIAALRGHVDSELATAVWEHALTTSWESPPVWVHGDLVATNLLVVDGRLGSVIDFGCSAVGDPACDLVITWTFLSGAARESFRRGVDLDRATWARARGWALWKAAIAAHDRLRYGAVQASEPRRIITEVLADHERHAR